MKWLYRPKYTFNSNRTQTFIKTMIVYFQLKDRNLCNPFKYDLRCASLWCWLCFQKGKKGKEGAAEVIFERVTKIILSALMVYFTCDPIGYSVIISEIIIILLLSLLPNISSSVIKLPIMIITDYTIPDHTINDWSYYFLVLIPNILLPILTITIWSYPELYYNR